MHKIILGWLLDTVTSMLELPPCHCEWCLHELLRKIPLTRNVYQYASGTVSLVNSYGQWCLICQGHMASCLVTFRRWHSKAWTEAKSGGSWHVHDMLNNSDG